MAGLFTPTSRSTGGAPNLKLASNSSPGFYNTRNGNSRSQKRQSLAPSNGNPSGYSDSSLSLKRVIGCSTTAFDCHPPSRSFAYTAGAAAVVVTLDDNLEVSQRFFRARPNAPTLTAAAGASFAPSTPQNPGQESRNRAAASLREAGIGYSAPSYGSGDDSSGGKTWTARERIKAATCLSFSPDGKWLAVGETGYNPRVLIFSMSKDVPSDVPVAAMSEHTFGVRDVAFSPDSKYLASIGTANDGFIYIWSLNPDRPNKRESPVQLHASNKCTSYIRQINWMGKCLITVGLRHVKIWKTNDEKAPPASGPQVLHGRNALLGNMGDSTMSCVVAISEDKALVCSERGDVCLLEENGMKFTKVGDVGYKVNCVAVDPERKFAWVAGQNGSHSALVLSDIVPPTPPASPCSSRSTSPVLPTGCRQANVLAMASMIGHLFTLDSNRSLKIINMTTVEGVPTPNAVTRELHAHKDACLGVRTFPEPLESGANFFTWSADGAVLFWDVNGNCKDEFQVELEQLGDGEDDAWNELKVVRVTDCGDYFVTGDKYGVLRVIDAKTRRCQYDVKAHGGEIMDIAIHNSTIVSAARDRTAQVFHRDETGSWSLTQTLDDHTASVSKVLFLEDGNKLLSCSTDRTIVVRELCRREAIDGTVTFAYVPIRTLSTKASPVHMTAFSDNSNILLVSTLDRQIMQFDMVTGQSIHSFKANDNSGDTVVMDSITLAQDRGTSWKSRIVVGTSTTDKSIRVYNLNGTLIDKEWGHTEGVSDVALLENESGDDIKLISTGTDGTIMIWDFRGSAPLESPGLDRDGSDLDSPGLAPKNAPTAARTPLRKVLSKSELGDFASCSTPTTPDPARKSGSHSVGSMSPPRPALKKRTSAYSLNRGSLGPPKTVVPTEMSGAVSDSNLGPALAVNGRETLRSKIRDRTPSPPEAEKRQSLGTRRMSSTKKSDSGVPGNNVNTMAESLTRSLRSFRRKMDSASDNNGVRPEVLRDLQRELSLTIKDLGGHKKGHSSKRSKHLREADQGQVNDGDMMAALLEQYSSKLLSMVSDRLEEKYLRRDEAVESADSDNSEDTCIQDRPRTKERLETTGEG